MSTIPHTLVLKRAEQARIAGMGGIVCSAEEASSRAQDHRSGHGAGDARASGPPAQTRATRSGS